MTVTLWNYALKRLAAAFVPALICFVLVLELVDLFANISRYVSREVTFGEIGLLFLLYIPKCISYALSPALLFAATYTLAGFYAENELVAVLGSGISYRKFILPLLFAGLMLSAAGFIFQEYVVVVTFNRKNSLSAELLGFSTSLDRAQAVVRVGRETIDADGEVRLDGYITYYAQYYYDERKEIQNPVIIITDSSHALAERIDARRAFFLAGTWVFESVSRYSFQQGSVAADYHDSYTSPELNLDPVFFQNPSEEFGNLRLAEARRILSRIQLTDPTAYRSYLTDYYERFSFSLTPMIVILFSSTFAWMFKKNILLFSILASLSVSVVYYITEMLSILLAKQGYISPLTGAWFPAAIFGCAGLLLLKTVRT